MKVERGPRGGRMVWTKKDQENWGRNHAIIKPIFILIYKERINIMFSKLKIGSLPKVTEMMAPLLSSAVPSEARAQSEPGFSEAKCSSSTLSPQLPLSSLSFRTASIHLDGE